MTIMNIDAQIDTLSRALVTVLGVAILVISGALIYICSILLVLRRELQSRYRLAQLARRGRRHREHGV
jgi:hypothetical protein